MTLRNLILKLNKRKRKTAVWIYSNSCGRYHPIKYVRVSCMSGKSITEWGFQLPYGDWMCFTDTDIMATDWKIFNRKTDLK